MKIKIIDTPEGACLKFQADNGQKLSLSFKDREKPLEACHFRESIDYINDYCCELNGVTVETKSFPQEIVEFIVENS